MSNICNFNRRFENVTWEMEHGSGCSCCVLTCSTVGAIAGIALIIIGALALSGIVSSGMIAGELLSPPDAIKLAFGLGGSLLVLSLVGLMAACRARRGVLASSDAQDIVKDFRTEPYNISPSPTKPTFSGLPEDLIRVIFLWSSLRGVICGQAICKKFWNALQSNLIWPTLQTEYYPKLALPSHATLEDLKHSVLIRSGAVFAKIVRTCDSAVMKKKRFDRFQAPSEAFFASLSLGNKLVDNCKFIMQSNKSVAFLLDGIIFRELIDNSLMKYSFIFPFHITRFSHLVFSEKYGILITDSSHIWKIDFELGKVDALGQIGVPITAVAVWESTVLLGSGDPDNSYSGSVHSLNIKTGEQRTLIQRLSIHSLYIYHDLLFIGTGWSIIKIWDLQGREELATLNSKIIHQDGGETFHPVDSMVVLENTLWVVQEDKISYVDFTPKSLQDHNDF